eukprot:scaffold2973_cov908-Pavlova_lutheri.AAC.1
MPRCTAGVHVRLSRALCCTNGITPPSCVRTTRRAQATTQGRAAPRVRALATVAARSALHCAEPPRAVRVHAGRTRATKRARGEARGRLAARAATRPAAPRPGARPRVPPGRTAPAGVAARSVCALARCERGGTFVHGAKSAAPEDGCPEPAPGGSERRHLLGEPAPRLPLHVAF